MVDVRFGTDTRLQAVPRPPPRFQLRAEASYLLVGGLGGIGIEMAKWMVDEGGAKSLILISRSGMDAARAADTVEALRRPDVVITVRKCDVADKEALAAVLQDCVQTLPPIRGVVQGAMVLRVSQGTISHTPSRQGKHVANRNFLGCDLPKHDPHQILPSPQP